MLVTACPNGNLYNAKRHKFYLLSENFSLPQDVFTFMYACVISDSEVRLLVGRKDDSGWSFSSAVVRRNDSGTAASSIKQIPRQQGESADNNECKRQRHWRGTGKFSLAAKRICDPPPIIKTDFGFVHDKILLYVTTSVTTLRYPNFKQQWKM